MDDFYWTAGGEFPVYCCGVLNLTKRIKSVHHDPFFDPFYYTKEAYQKGWDHYKRSQAEYLKSKDNKRHFLITSEDGIELAEVKRLLAMTVHKDKYMLATNADGKWVVGIFEKAEV